jgi:pyrroline-5-carboxylate reductase
MADRRPDVDDAGTAISVADAADGLCVVGGGNMGTALIRGLIAAGADPGRLSVAEVSDARRAELVELLPGVAVDGSIAGCRSAVIAVKPADTPAACAAAVAAGARRILSIAAGIRIADLEAAAGDGVAVIRSMPNTPALVGAGASALARGSRAGVGDIAWAEALLGAVGTVVEVTETQLDAVTGLTGSGPAYLFLVAEALIDAGVGAGLSRAVADGLVRQLFTGAAALLAQSDTDPATLRAMVTSPGGTTAAGLAALEDRATRAAFAAAVAAAVTRSRELA